MQLYMYVLFGIIYLGMVWSGFAPKRITAKGILSLKPGGRGSWHCLSQLFVDVVS